MKSKYTPNKYMILSLLMIIGFLVNPNAISISPSIIPDHQYFLKQDFGLNQNMDLWEGEFNHSYSGSTVHSSRATTEISLSSWNGHDPLLFSMELLHSDPFREYLYSAPVVLEMRY